MKKRYLIIIVAQAVLVVLMLVFAILQKQEADKQREVAEVNARAAQEQMIIAEHTRAELQTQVNTLKAELARFDNE
jgi:hypothetical protein